MNVRELLANNIKDRRHEMNLSQASLARKVGMSTNFLAMIELCLKFPSPEMLDRIAEALGIDVSELFSQAPSLTRSIQIMQKKILGDLKPAITESTTKALESTIQKVLDEYQASI
ncbi:MAG: helix-turn-helix transcriptional regulator [Spirochaetaceae bacterium]|nr:helix-turn-helix transcriptional regulator [Spirochaetaceae bacterium]